jgi:hypothetical protein
METTGTTIPLNTGIGIHGAGYKIKSGASLAPLSVFEGIKKSLPQVKLSGNKISLLRVVKTA